MVISLKLRWVQKQLRTILNQMDIESTISELRESFHSLTGQKNQKQLKVLEILSHCISLKIS